MLAAVLVLEPSHARARDLPKSDPDRKLILDAARGDDHVTFVVKDLYKDGDFALLCALTQDPGGGIYGTDGQIDVQEWVLIAEDGCWTAHVSAESLAMSMSSVSCPSAARTGRNGPGVNSRADIIDTLVRSIRSDLLQDFAGRHPIDKLLPLLDVLGHKGLERGISMDDEKVLHDFRVSIISDVCKDERCKTENRRTLARIERLRKSDAVSALAWEVCDDTAGRAESFTAFERCLTTAAATPTCRTGLRMPEDQQALEQCAAALPR